MAFNQRRFVLFLREGALVRSTLAMGLTALRQARPSQVGTFYVAFFHLSTALERLMKLIIILNFFYEGQKPNKQVRKFSHKLVQLFEKSGEIAARHNMGSLFRKISQGSIEWEILEVLDRFARSTRYANIDALLDNSKEFEDPLSVWHNKVVALLFESIPRSVRERDIGKTLDLANLLASNAVVAQINLDGGVMGDLAEVFLLEWLYEKVSPYAVWHMTRIFFPLKEVMVYLSERTSSIPCMREFFDDFSLDDRQRIMRKQRWP